MTDTIDTKIRTSVDLDLTSAEQRLGRFADQAGERIARSIESRVAAATGGARGGAGGGGGGAASPGATAWARQLQATGTPQAEVYRAAQQGAFGQGAFPREVIDEFNRLGGLSPMLSREEQAAAKKAASDAAKADVAASRAQERAAKGREQAAKREEREQGRTEAQRERFIRSLGGYGRLGGYGMLAVGAGTLYGAVGEFSQAGVGLERGMLSGNLGSALQAETGYRQNISRGYLHAGQGGAQVLAGGLALYGGLPGAIAGAGIGVITAIAGPIIDSYFQKTAIREGAAAISLQNFMNRRGALAGQQWSLAGIGGGLESDVAMSRNAATWGVAPSQQEAMAGSFFRSSRGAGSGMSRGYLSALSILGVDAGATGGLMAPLASGQGTLGATSQKAYLEAVLAAGVSAGVELARMPELLQRVASANEAMQQSGAHPNLMRGAAVMQGLSNAGMVGMEGATFAGAADRGVMGLGSSITEMLLPSQARKGIMMQLAFQRFGINAPQKLAELGANHGGPEFMRDAAKMLGPTLAPLMLAGETGMIPGTAGKALGLEVGDVGAFDVIGEAARTKDANRGVFLPSQRNAQAEAMQTFAEGLPMLAKYLDEFVNLMAINIASMRKHTPGMLAEHGEMLGESGHAGWTFPNPERAAISVVSGGVGERR